MGDEVKSLSDDEYNRIMYGSHGHAAITNAMSQDTQQQARDPGIVQANPAIPPRAVPQKTNSSPNVPLNRIINSVPQEPDANAVANQVNKIRDNLRISTPPPVAPSAVHQLADEVTSNWKIPVAVATTMATVKAAEWGIKKGMSALENRRIAKEQAGSIDRTVDIPMEKVPSAFTSKLAAESEAKFGAPLADVEKHFNIKISNLKDAEILTNSYKNSLPQGMTPGIPTGQPNVSVNPAGAFTQPSGYGTAPQAPVLQPGQFDPARIGQPLQDPLAGRGYQTPAQDIDPRIPPTQVATQTAAQAIDAVPAELRTGTGKPAYAGQGPAAPISTKTKKPMFQENYPSLAQVPSTHAWIPNAQYIDPLRQDLGPKAYKEAYTVRNFPASNEIAREEAKTINRELGRATREEAKLAGLPPADITPGITEKTTKGYKKVVVGGLGAGALVALPNLASAAQQGDAKAAAEAIGYAIPGISQMLSVRDINKAYKEGGWAGAAHMAADVATMGGLSGAEHLLSYVPQQKYQPPSVNKPRLGAVPPAFSQYYK